MLLNSVLIIVVALLMVLWIWRWPGQSAGRQQTDDPREQPKPWC